MRSPPDAYDIIRALLPFADAEVDRGGAEARIIGHWCASGSPWESLVEEAEYHGVTPLLAPMITSGPGSAFVPSNARRIFEALARRHRRASDAREACIEQLLMSFAGAGMPMLLLKGAALSHTLYSAPHLRPALDIDILIDPADEQQVIELIRDLGYVFARGHGSRFARRLHHLPVARKPKSGFSIALEVHHRALHPDQPRNLTLRSSTRPRQIILRGAGSPGLAFGHVDMLDHLSRHAFEPARRLRLIHLYDLWRYRARFRDAVDWQALRRSHPQVIVVQQLVNDLFSRGSDAFCGAKAVPAGVGAGMIPLSQIAAANLGWTAKVGKVFNPPAWWLHGYYGVPLEGSLFACRVVRHPVTVTRWLGRRLVARMSSPAL